MPAPRSEGMKKAAWDCLPSCGARSVSAVFALIVATHVFASEVAQTFRIGGDRGASKRIRFQSVVRAVCRGHLVGLWVGVAMRVGALIAWVWGVPHYTALAARSRVVPPIWQRQFR